MAKEEVKMRLEEHEETFNGFVRIAGWACVISFAVLVFLALVNS